MQVFAVLGFLSPANRGGLMSAMLLLFVFMGLCGGYAAGRIYRQVRFAVCPLPSGLLDRLEVNVYAAALRSVARSSRRPVCCGDH